MSKIVLDDAVFAQLDRADGRVELCDRTGQIRGFFLTPEQYQKVAQSWAKEQFTDDESLKALESARQTGGRSTKEVLAFLEGIEFGLNHRS